MLLGKKIVLYYMLAASIGIKYLKKMNGYGVNLKETTSHLQSDHLIKPTSGDFHMILNRREIPHHAASLSGPNKTKVYKSIDTIPKYQIWLRLGHLGCVLKCFHVKLIYLQLVHCPFLFYFVCV